MRLIFFAFPFAVGAESGDKHLSNFVFPRPGQNMLLRLAFLNSFGVVMPWMQNPWESCKHRANFEGKGTLAVNEYEFGISPYGCYNMAGNVKEWCLNEVSSGYISTGGSWKDPYYVFAYYGVHSGFYSSSLLGFRCVRNSASGKIDQSAKDCVDPNGQSYQMGCWKNQIVFYSYLS